MRALSTRKYGMLIFMVLDTGRKTKKGAKPKGTKHHINLLWNPPWMWLSLQGLTLSARDPFQNFSTPCILNVNNTGAKQGSIMK
jgi:hypothetical protein